MTVWFKVAKLPYLVDFGVVRSYLCKQKAKPSPASFAAREKEDFNMASDADGKGTCPIAQVHTRLEDAHTQWHQAQHSYFSPDEFRVAIHACIQTLRTVTFVLQAHKRQIPDFDTWYAGWRAKMDADVVMKWAVEARNHIEKRGDLETYSEVNAKVIASYLDNIPVAIVNGELFDSVKEMLKNVPPEYVEHQVFEHGVLRIERRWVANSLPTHELLDALAHVYGVLSQIVDDAHTQMGLETPRLARLHKNEMIAVPGGGPIDKRLPCMLSRDEKLVAEFSLKDGSVLNRVQEVIEFDEKTAREHWGKYGFEKEIARTPPSNLRENARIFFSMAKKIFLKDGYHIPMVFLFRKHQPVGQIGMEFANRNDKYLLMRDLATEVEKTGADSIIHIGEVWYAAAESIPRMGYAVDSPEKKEALMLAACSRQETFELQADIIRSDKNVILGKTLETNLEISDMFAPVRAVWAKQDEKN